ncbi:hypothetical protein ES708_22881 [subsurface metagenome]
MQFVCTIIIIIVTSTLGLKPTSAHEYFTLLQSDRIVGLLRDDFSSLIIISLYLVTFFALYGALRRVNGVYAALANGFDLAQHLIHPFVPTIASILLMIAGPFYLLWFPFLGRDLFKIGRLEKKITVEKQGATLP